MTDQTAPIDPATAGTNPAPAPAPAADPNVFVFGIPNTDTQISIELANIPAEVRLDFLRKGVRDYVTNSVNQANVRANKANAAFNAFDEAVKADPLQTAVAKPEGERTDPKLLDVAAAARDRLYKGEIRKQGEGTGKKRETVDPLVKMVTDAVTREYFDKKKAADPKYTFVMAKAEVGSDGIAFLNARIDAAVAAGQDRATLEKVRDERYVKPAELMLGRRTTKATADTSLLG